MTPRVTVAVAARVLTQIRRDHRTLAMLLVLPCALISLLWWMFEDLPGDSFDQFGPGLLALFPFIIMFLVTSVTTLRERSGGTLERLLSMPMGKLDFLLGYALAFGLVAAVQSVLAVLVSVGLLGLDVVGPVWLLMLVAVADAVLGTALGLFVSAFATTEFQAVQFMPLVVIPQILLCGLFVPRDALPAALEAISNVLPLSYAVDAMSHLVVSSTTAEVWRDIAVVVGFVLAGPDPRRCHPAATYGVACTHVLAPPTAAAAGPQRAAQEARQHDAGVRRHRQLLRPGRDHRRASSTPPRRWSPTGWHVSLDHLGEDTLDAEQADATVAAYKEVLEALSERGLARRTEVSVKLSAIGQALEDNGHKVALENARAICRAARNAGTTVTLDMEDHTTTDSTLAILRDLRKDFPETGAVLQAYLLPHRGRLPGPGLRGLPGAAVQGRLPRARGRRLPGQGATSTSPTCAA